MAAYLFELDMTLLDSSASGQDMLVQLGAAVARKVAAERIGPPRGTVEQAVAHVRAFPGTLPPHALPARLKSEGHAVAVVTESARWYAEELLKRFNIPTDVIVASGDTEYPKPDPQPLKMALDTLGVAPEDAYYVGASTVDVEASYYAGVCSVGAGWGVTDFEKLCDEAPDILVCNPEAMLENLGQRGYLAEVICSNGARPEGHRGGILPCGSAPGPTALGRYMAASDPRHLTSALSANILELKNSDAPASLFATAVAAFIQECGWTPDFVVPVPPKPSQGRQRFAGVLEAARPLLPSDTMVVPDGLSCTREVTDDYKALGPKERSIAVRGAFASVKDWKGGKVLLVDDVLTSGGTIAECTGTLRKGNASEVRAVVFGKSQQAFEGMMCDECGGSMRLRRNNRTGKPFWGCARYPDCRYTEEIEGPTRMR